MSRTRLVLFCLTAVAYAFIVLTVLAGSRLVALDWQVMLVRPYKQWPEYHTFLDYFVVLGQRGPTAVIVTAWLGWRSWRQHTLRPLLVLGTALLLLNVSVGSVKYGLGRLGPHYALTLGSAELFRGGDIFPSGHTANAVVTWGILAYLATTARARRVLSVISAMLALGVGMTTIYLGTHWVSDVLSGWCAGLLVLLAMPWYEPALGRAEQWLTAARTAFRKSRAAGRPAAATRPRVRQPRPVAEHTAVRHPTGARAVVRPGPAAPHGVRHGVRPHNGRHERPAAAGPGGTRRPYPDRPPGSMPPIPSVPPVPSALHGRGTPD